MPSASGLTVPLPAVADVRIAEGPSTIKRFNRQQRATIGASLPPGIALNTATDRFKKIAAETTIPSNVALVEARDAEVQQELTASFGSAMVLDLMLVLTVLILLFKDVLQPFTILLSLPLSIGGVGEGGPFRAPMAIGVIGGIIVSTVLSLVIVPSFFLIMDDASRLPGKIFGRVVGPKEPEPPALDPAALTQAVAEDTQPIDALTAAR